MSKIDEAVINCRAEIAVVQAALHNLWVLERVLLDDYSQMLHDYDKETMRRLRTALQTRLCVKWDKLAHLSPVSAEAAQLIREKAESWFTNESHEIMSWLKPTGGEYVADEKAFQAELKKAFTVSSPIGVHKNTKAKVKKSAKPKTQNI